MLAEAMGTIVVNSLQLSGPSPPSLSHFALKTEAALVRLDGQYGGSAETSQAA
jgi:hypothetical protein